MLDLIDARAIRLVANAMRHDIIDMLERSKSGHPGGSLSAADAMATLFTLLALLLIPHAVIRAIIGQALHQWTPITWLAIHTALTIAALATSLASYAIAALLAPPRPETYQ